MPIFSLGTSRRRQHGFALMWVLMSVVLIGLGLAMAIEMNITLERRNKEKELLSIGRQFRDALRSYAGRSAALGLGPCLMRLEDLVWDQRSTSGMPVRHLRKIFADPMTGRAQWELVLEGGCITGIRSSSTKLPIKQDRFDDESRSFKQASSYRDWVIKP